jgi:hypothetical protein
VIPNSRIFTWNRFFLPYGHRGLVKRKWTFRQGARLGKPRIDAELEALIVRLAEDNPGLGYEKSQGELSKLVYVLGVSTMRDVLHRYETILTPYRALCRNAGCTQYALNALIDCSS